MVKKDLRLFIILFLFLMAIVTVSATPTVKKDQPYNIDHSVRIGEAPTTSALCNITVWNPSNIVLVSFKSMTANVSTQSYNYTVVNTSLLGFYDYDITCLLNGLNKTKSFNFEVTPTGKTFSTGQSIIYFLMFTLAIFFFLFFCILTAKIEWGNDPQIQEGEVIPDAQYIINYKKYLKPIVFIFAYCTLLLIAYMAWDISYGILFFYGLGKLFFFIARVMLAFLGVLLPATIIVMLLTFIKDKRFKKEYETFSNLGGMR